MLDVLKMSRWLPLSKMQALAKGEALALTTRWDVPNGPEVPEDLRDVCGRFHLTAPDEYGFQSRVMGRMLTQDMALGAFPASIPLLFTLVPVLAMLMVFSPGWLMVLLGLATAALLVFIATATENKWWSVAALAAGFGLPLLGAGGSPGAPSILNGALHIFPWWMLGLGILSTLLFTLLCVWLFSGPRGVRVTTVVVFSLIATVVLAQMVPSWAAPFVLAVPGCLLPLGWFAHQNWERAKELVTQGASSFEDGRKATLHIPARKQQAEEAMKDTSPLITYGIATGTLTAKWDGFAPDKGLPVRQSVFDLSTHQLTIGSTGRGKTELIKKVIKAYTDAEAGGIVIMDGKGSLPEIFSYLPNYLLMEPTRCDVGLYQGMTAVQVARTLYEIHVKDGAADGKNAMWINSAFTLASHSAHFLEAMVAFSRNDAKRPWKWTMHDHCRLADLAASGLKKDQDYMVKLVQWVEDKLASCREKDPETKHISLFLLQDAIQYFKSVFPGTPEDQKGGIKGQFDSWMSPALSHPDILRWARTEEGEMIEEALHGRFVGVNLPSTRYGQAGIIAAAFLKNRLYNSVRRRADAPKGDWRKADPTATTVLNVMDECQLLLGEADYDLAPIGRSLGCWLSCLSQTIESIQATSKNAALTEAFLDSFQTVICLSSSAGTIDWVTKRVGKAWIPQFNTKAVGIDFVGSVAAAFGSPLFDPTHPQRGWMKSLLRWGAGGFRPLHEQTLKLGNVEKDLLFPLRTTAGTEGWKEEPLISEADFRAMTAQKGMALALLTRGGVPRRDFIKLGAPTKLDEQPEPTTEPTTEEVSA